MYIIRLARRKIFKVLPSKDVCAVVKKGKNLVFPTGASTLDGKISSELIKFSIIRSE